MPLRQLGLCTASTPGRSTATAPVTTTIGAAPAVAKQRHAALGEPLAADLDERLRLPEPAPPARGEQDPGDSRLPHVSALHACQAKPGARPSGWQPAEAAVVDAAGGGGERTAGAAPAQLDQLGGDRDRGLLGRPCPQVEPDRRAQPGQLVLGQADLAEPGQPVVVRPPAAHRPDVAGRGAQRHLEQRHVELGVVGEHADDRPLVHVLPGQVPVRPVGHHLVRVGEPRLRVANTGRASQTVTR